MDVYSGYRKVQYIGKVQRAVKKVDLTLTGVHFTVAFAMVWQLVAMVN